MTDQHLQSSPTALRAFGLLMAGAISLVFGLLLPSLFADNYPIWPWIVAAGFLAAAWLMPGILGPIRSVWMRLAEVLGYVNTRLILGLLYYALVSPVGMLRRMLGRDTVAARIDKAAVSYRQASAQRKARHMEEPF